MLARMIFAAVIAGAAVAAAQEPAPEASGAKAFFDAEEKTVHFVEEAPRPTARSGKRPVEREPESKRASVPTLDRAAVPAQPSPPGGAAGAVPAEPLSPSASGPPAVAPASPVASGAEGPSMELAGAAPAAAIPAGVRYWIELRTPGGSVPVAAQRTFASGDRIRLHVYSNVAGRLALFYAGSSGEESRWVPPPSSAERAIEIPAYSQISVPPPGSWLAFDDRPGIERIFLVFGRDGSRLDLLPDATAPRADLLAGFADLAVAARGSKDVLWETEEGSPAEIGTYAVSLSGSPLVIEIPLDHR